MHLHVDNLRDHAPTFFDHMSSIVKDMLGIEANAPVGHLHERSNCVERQGQLFRALKRYRLER